MRKLLTLALSVGIGLALLPGGASVVIGAQEGLRSARQSRAMAPPLETPFMSANLGPMPQLDPITRFIAPIDPWDPGGPGWGVEALDGDGVPLCMTNYPPATTCDPEGPRAFLHAGFDAKPAADRVVHASAAGRVVIAAPTSGPVTGRSPGEGAGIVVLEHDIDGDPSTLDDRVLTVYSHVDPQVATGAIVAQGDPIALTSTQHGGDHLHFAVRRAAYDPADVDVFRTLLPPEGTSQCVSCSSRPLPVPAFPDRWEDPEALFRGSPFWLAIYGQGEDAANDILETDDGYLAFGFVRNGPNPSERSMAVKRLDREGNIVSQRAYNVTNIDSIRRVERAPDGGVIALAGSFSEGSFGGQVPMLLKLDATGEPQWQRQYQATTLINNLVVRLWWEDIAVTSDGGYVVTGSAQIQGLHPYAAVIRLDAAGNVQWVRTYEPGFAQSGLDGKGIAQTADGGFVVAAEYQVLLQSNRLIQHVLVFRIDADGQLLWGTLAGTPSNDARAGQIEATPDGGSIFVGSKTVFGPTLPSTVWILKLDGDGTIAWESLYASEGPLKDHHGTRLVVTSDGYVVGGSRTDIFEIGPQLEFDTDLFVMRLDGAGEIVGQRRIDSIGDRMTVLGLRAATDEGFLLAGGPESDCRVCFPLDREISSRFLVAHLDADLDTSQGCTTEGDFVRLQETPIGVTTGFRVGGLIVTPVDATLTRVDTNERRYPCGGGAFGPPPMITVTSMQAVQQTVSCDRTSYLEAFLCTVGVTGARATSPVILNVTYDSLRLAARVFDLDSTLNENDVVGVDAGIGLFQGGYAIPMLDDGSQTNVSEFFDSVTVCSEDPFQGLCTCHSANPPTFSGDVVTHDDVFTREPSLSGPPLEVATGCMIEALPRRPLLYFPAGTPVSVAVRAKDRIGNVSHASGFVTPAGASVSCFGDPCGCCLLVSRDPFLECNGLEGMPSPDFPAGLCKAF